MIAEAIQKIRDMVSPETYDLDGLNYSSRELVSVASRTPPPDLVSISTLDGLVDYVNSPFDKPDDGETPDGTTDMCCVISSPTDVTLTSALDGDFNQRLKFVKCAARVRPYRWPDRYIDIEDFIIGIQQLFIQDNTTADLLKIVGNLKSEAIGTLQDDGITQIVATRSGIASVANVELPNPITLRPYRTFHEIEQPASQFVLRLKGSGGETTAALFSTDDRQWETEAILSIKKYLKEKIEIPIFG